MADLQSCFFCGTPEELNQYAVVPPRYTDDGDPQSAVLCPQCKRKLLQVIEPLVNRLEGSEPESASQQGESPTPGSDGITMTAQERAERARGAAESASSDNAESASEPAPSTDEGPAETPAGGDSAAPPNYRRAMRMLETRQFPLERTAVESLLANAYDMETHELEAVLSHAVETGDLREEDGQFLQ